LSRIFFNEKRISEGRKRGKFMTRNVGLAVLLFPNIKTIKRRMRRKRDVDIGRVFRHKERHVNVGKGM
jgi:hypothetical protein